MLPRAPAGWRRCGCWRGGHGGLSLASGAAAPRRLRSLFQGRRMKEGVSSNSTTSISQARKAVEQLKMEACMDRVKVGPAAPALPPSPHATKQPAWRACHPAGHPPLRCCDIYKQALAPGLRVPAGHPPQKSPQAKGSARHPRRMRATPGASVARMVPSGVGGPSGDCRGNGSRPLRGPPGRGASQRRPRRFGHSRPLCRGAATPAPALRGRSNALGCFLLTQP